MNRQRTMNKQIVKMSRTFSSLPLHQQPQLHPQELLQLSQYSRQSQAQVPN